MSTKNVRHVAVAAALLFAASAYATENGGQTVGLGAEGFAAGALPPPGLYGLIYYNSYNASQFSGNNGNSMIPGFGVHANTIAPRLVYMTDKTIAGGLLGFYALFPLTTLSVSAGGRHDSRTGLGDSVFAPLLSWHHGNFHWAVAAEVVTPTGAYDKTRLANLGNNYYSFRPMGGFSYLDPNGFDISTKFSYTINTRNNDTDYRSGDYFAADYSIGYHVLPSLVIAVEGYYMQQLTNDKVGGVVVAPDGFKGRVLGVGPGIRYQTKAFSIEGRFIKETMVRNRSDGSSVWLKAVVPF
ncbi:transporter [Burkholderia cepacia]|uniref:SphA family protein n=1 Tax=Burkholderia cepacia TaxID=292 RepID=UPI0007C7174E|nr:transporter [Burkholderia cepacia]